ncbi:hypothetical protein PCH_Pc22g01050 [Penicillium rubens Wisconsin 54-1255]|uniref:Uncharacterized protein n=1 Tax=Penicillium rubens (strain ATCC 28089 / DSM 1075 / NRRL 1951 / Wisconsin 54-1255) TaxID=500485 RepID=B6HPP0_PENRW|nr:hypothetical protein PCH_Pc22g01050 [Penicillium rubens Wisconsin 54-1255]
MYTKYGGLYVGGLRCVDPQRLIEQSEPRMTTVVGSISFRRFFVERIDGQFDGGLDVGCTCWMIDCEGSPDCFSSPGTCRRTACNSEAVPGLQRGPGLPNQNAMRRTALEGTRSIDGQKALKKGCHIYYLGKDLTPPLVNVGLGGSGRRIHLS